MLKPEPRGACAVFSRSAWLRRGDVDRSVEVGRTGSVFMMRRPHAWLWLCAVSHAALLLWLFFRYHYLPIVDLPQHAAQLSAWVHLNDPSYGFADQFELNWTTPYLLCYLLARPFVGLLGVTGALELVLWITSVASAASFAWLLFLAEQELWLCLLGFPLSLGFSFYFGFINFQLATPLISFAVALGWAYARDPRWRLGLLLVALFGVTFVAHALAFVLAGAVSFLLVAGELWKRRGRLLALWPFAAVPVVLLPWIPGFLKSGSFSSDTEIWVLGMQRLWELPATLLSVGGADRLATWFGMGSLVLLVLSVGVPSRAWQRWSLFVLSLACYLLFPFKLRGVAFLYPRFLVLLVPGVLLLGSGKRALLPPWARRPLIVGACTAWLIVFGVRLRQFNREARGMQQVIAEMPPAQRVRPIVFERTSGAFPGAVPFLHFPAYYQAEKGGYYGFSFARYYTTFVRYRPGVNPGMREDQEWTPYSFDAQRDPLRYDYFIVRSDRDVSAELFASASRKIELASHFGQWWSYRVVKESAEAPVAGQG